MLSKTVKVGDREVTFKSSAAIPRMYRIMNMASWDDEELLNMYLTAYLLSLYEQTLCYESSPSVRNQFLIARPLGIFVGGYADAVGVLLL